MEAVDVTAVFALALLVEGITEYFLADLFQGLRLSPAFLGLRRRW